MTMKAIDILISQPHPSEVLTLPHGVRVKAISGITTRRGAKTLSFEGVGDNQQPAEYQFLAGKIVRFRLNRNTTIQFEK